MTRYSGSGIALLESFGRSALRQPIYTLLLLLPPLMGLLIRPLLLLLRRYLPSFDIDAWIPLILAVTAGFPPYLFGLLSALMLLDERDCDLLPALRVTPVGERSLLAAKILPAALLSLAGVPAALLFSGLAHRIPAWSPAVLGLMAAPTAAFYALLVTGLSGSKVQALTWGKILGTALAVPVLLEILPSPWRFGALAFPSSWMAALCIEERGGAVWAAGGLLYAILLVLLSWRMARRKYFI